MANGEENCHSFEFLGYLVNKNICTLSQAFFKHRERPTTNGPRCDACRAIAFRLDRAFDFAESSHISGRSRTVADGPEELSEKEVATIAAYICSKTTFRDVKPFKVLHSYTVQPL